MLKVCSEGFCIFCKYCRTQWNILYFCPPVSCTNIETWGNTRSFQSTFAMKHNILSAQCRHRPSLISTVTVTRDMGRMGIFHQNFKGFHGSHVHHQNIISYYVHRYLKVFCQLLYIYRVFFFLWIQSGGCKWAILRSFQQFLYFLHSKIWAHFHFGTFDP